MALRDIAVGSIGRYISWAAAAMLAWKRKTRARYRNGFRGKTHAISHAVYATSRIDGLTERVRDNMGRITRRNRSADSACFKDGGIWLAYSYQSGARIFRSKTNPRAQSRRQVPVTQSFPEQSSPLGPAFRYGLSLRIFLVELNARLRRV